MTGAAVIGGVAPGDAGLVGAGCVVGAATAGGVVDGAGCGVVTTGFAVVVVACDVTTGGVVVTGAGTATVDEVAEEVLAGSDLMADVVADPVQPVSITAIRIIPTRAENNFLTLICLPYY
jgi:hypothetical protein